MDGGISMRATAWMAIFLAVCTSVLSGHTVQLLTGTFSNMSASKESGDINGYEIVAIPQADGPWIVFQCSEGAPSPPVLVPIQVNGDTFSFNVEDHDNACNGSYIATRTKIGLTLRGASDGETQTLLKGPSYWTNHKPVLTPYERATRPFFRALQVSCRDKHLEDLPPADLNYQIELFEPKLTGQQDKEFRAEAKVRCKNAIAGTGCGNVAFLDIAERRAFLPNFVEEICHAQLKCSAVGECTSK
jgi:hypothetical protein